MTETRFDPALELPLVPGFVWSRRNERASLRLVVDTGSSLTLVAPHVLDSLGYSARSGEARTVIRSAVAEEAGYLVRVSRSRALGQSFEEFRVHAHDLPEGYDLDGLRGWDFLSRFNVEFRPGEGRILTELLGASSGPGSALR